MDLIKTKGRARQKTFTLAKKANVELKAVVFTRKELIKALGYEPDRKYYGTKKDRCVGRCWQDAKVIWLYLPASVNTIAHEVMHLVTRTSHYNSSFKNRTVVLARGKDIKKVKSNTYEVKVVTTRIYQVTELTANEAKKKYYRGNVIHKSEKITARKKKE